MDRPAVVLTVVLVSVVFAGTAAGFGPPALADGQDFDRIQFQAVVHEDESAVWTFRYERRLANETERTRFEAYAQRFNTNETPLFRNFRNQTLALAALGREATGRPMNATEIARRAFVRESLNTVGVVELSFTWTAFAVADDDRVIVGDVFEGGFYIGPDQAFVIGTGDGLRFASIDPAGTLSGGTTESSDTVTWRGERTFTDNHPRVVMVPTDQPTATTGTEPSIEGPTTVVEPSPAARTTVANSTSTPTESGPPWALIGLAVLVVIGGTTAVVWFRRDRSASASTANQPGADTKLTEADLMADEDVVLNLIENNGGQMRQSAIVEETGWSKSKVSMVLSDMTDEGLVSKLQLGRENLISLPGAEPAATGSALEDSDDTAE